MHKLSCVVLNGFTCQSLSPQQACWHSRKDLSLCYLFNKPVLERIAWPLGIQPWRKQPGSCSREAPRGVERPAFIHHATRGSEWFSLLQWLH